MPIPSPKATQSPSLGVLGSHPRTQSSTSPPLDSKKFYSVTMRRLKNVQRVGKGRPSRRETRGGEDRETARGYRRRASDGAGSPCSRGVLHKHGSTLQSPPGGETDAGPCKTPGQPRLRGKLARGERWFTGRAMLRCIAEEMQRRAGNGAEPNRTVSAPTLRAGALSLGLSAVLMGDGQTPLLSRRLHAEKPWPAPVRRDASQNKMAESGQNKMAEPGQNKMAEPAPHNMMKHDP